MRTFCHELERVNRQCCNPFELNTLPGPPPQPLVESIGYPSSRRELARGLQQGKTGSGRLAPHEGDLA